MTLAVAALLDRLRPEFEKQAAPFSNTPSALLALLHAAQEALGHITPEAEHAVAEFLGMGVNRVHEAVTFYTLYRRAPYGRHHFQVCRTLSCDLCGVGEVKAAIRKKLGDLPPRTPSSDGLFSWEEVECLGCCDKAPVLQLNMEPYRGPMTGADAERLIDELRKREGANGKS